jgi:creatinase/prolidase-like protein
MRRGLMHWDPEELPVAVLEQRIARLRGMMTIVGLDAFILYTNLVRPSAVAHLTGFTPYWSEGLLLVPPSGRLTFATALSNRVADWIRSTNPVSEVVSTPRPGKLLGERLAGDAAVKRVGVLEFDAMPSELAGDLAAAAPSIAWIDGSAPFASVRRRIDAAEQRILVHADALAVAALDQVGAATATDAGTLAGLVEQHARLAGAEEIYVALAPDLVSDRRLNRVSKPAALAERFAVRASLAYKGSWVRRTRTFASDGAVADADTWFTGVVRGIAAGTPIASWLARNITSLPGATLESWMVERCVGCYPLTVTASSRSPADDTPTNGSFLVLTVELMLDGGPWIGSAPVFVGTDFPAVITRESG